MTAYYNEFDPFAAAWLRELIRDGLIAPGDVDERSIVDVQPSDLNGYTQVHFFAGIGGWSIALRLAGWPDDRPVWTGSCPCQPFSSAGKRQGQADARHLWPEMFRLVRECRPDVVFGEQVEAAIRLGWVDGVHADLEGEGYAFGFAVLGAHSVGSPHIRQRLFWVADATNARHAGAGQGTATDGDGADSVPQREGSFDEPARRGPTDRLGDVLNAGLEGLTGHGDDGNEPGRIAPHAAGSTAEAGGDGGMGYPMHGRLQEYAQRDGQSLEHSTHGDSRGADAHGSDAWAEYRIIPCRDGKLRRIPAQAQPVFQCVVDGVSGDMDVGGIARAAEGYPLAGKVPNRVGLLRGFGNAISPQLAAAFVTAYLETKETK